MAAGRGRGRPVKLDQPVVVRRRLPNGSMTDVTLTAAEAVLDRIRTGAPKAEAAASAGIVRQTFDDWLRRGARARQALAAGQRVSALDHKFIEFADEVDRLRSEALVANWSRLSLLAQGGLEQTTITEKVDAATGAVIERTVKKESSLPDIRAIIWQLEKGYPHAFPNRVEVSGPEGEAISVEVRAAQVADRLRALQGGQVVELQAGRAGASGASDNGRPGGHPKEE